MRNINFKDKRTTMSLKRPNSSYMHLYLILLTFLCIVKPAEGQCGAGKYYCNNCCCCNCQPGRYQPNNNNLPNSCTLCAAGKYSRCVSSTSTCAPTITATHMLILYMLLILLIDVFQCLCILLLNTLVCEQVLCVIVEQAANPLVYCLIYVYSMTESIYL